MKESVSIRELVNALQTLTGRSYYRSRIKLIEGLATLMDILSEEERVKALMAMKRDGIEFNRLKSNEGERAKLRYWWERLANKGVRVFPYRGVVKVMVEIDDLSKADAVGEAIKYAVGEHLIEGDVYVYAGDKEDTFLLEADVRVKGNPDEYVDAIRSRLQEVFRDAGRGLDNWL